ncbi:MotA/TolQ/ExbB proton channel family protein [Candidatus Vesicomyidisocius sp. SY067_SCS001]
MTIVAYRIAEALIATVFGLFFAIPATITYNCLIYSSRSN